jgi:hypothetical protein
MIRSVRDIVSAYEAGRSHTQRVIKTGASRTGDSQWQDWSFTAGQPGYDARVGTEGRFNPFVASGNDAVYFPPIPSDMERRLAGVTYLGTASGIDQVSRQFQLYDLLGVYPLIDGDSAETQEFDNTQTLPRYATGNGVYAVLVNHISPTIASGTGTMVYMSCDGTEKTTTFGIRNVGVNKVVGAVNSSSATDANLFIPLADGCHGVRNVKSVTLSGGTSGLFAIYLVKPIEVFSDLTGITGVSVSTFSELCTCSERAFRLPKIEDGAWLGLFYMPLGGSRAISQVHAEFTFIWG